MRHAADQATHRADGDKLWEGVSGGEPCHVSDHIICLSHCDSASRGYIPDGDGRLVPEHDSSPQQPHAIRRKGQHLQADSNMTSDCCQICKEQDLS